MKHGGLAGRVALNLFFRGAHFHHLNFTEKRETVCVASETITKFDYYNKTPELKTQAEVHEAYKNGRLVGY